MEANDRSEDSLSRAANRAPVRCVPTFDPAWLSRATLLFVTLGVLLRGVRYLLNYPLWCDETMLAANLLERGYLDMFSPLAYRQVCPILFLEVELTAIKLMGFSEWTLRLFPFVCAIAGMLLFRHLAGRLMRGEALLLAVAIFAVSTSPLRFAAEVKPYASDLLVALMLLTFALEWWRRPERTGWLWALVLLAPLALGMSFPAIFVAGGVSIGLLGVVRQSNRRDVWFAYAVYNFVVAASFLLLLRFYKTNPRDHVYFQHDWAPAFPPLDSLWKFIVWFFQINTAYLFAYPDGGGHGGSTLTFFCFLVATVVLWRRGRRTVLVLCLAPFGLTLAAAALHRYPYGFSARTAQYLAPTICLMAGLGAAALLSGIHSTKSRRRLFLGVAAGLALFGFGRMVYDLSHPYRGFPDELHRGFARWFWMEKSRNAELVCPKADFGLEFSPEHWTKDGVDTYLCYQKLHSPRHQRGEPPRLDIVSASHPLRFVFFNEFPEGSPAFQSWLAGMRRDFDLKSIDFYPISAPLNEKRTTWDIAYLTYEFTPKAGPSLSSLVGISRSGPVRR